MQSESISNLQNELGLQMMKEIQNFDSKAVCSESPFKQSTISEYDEIKSGKPKKKKKKILQDKVKIILNVSGMFLKNYYINISQDTVYQVVKYVGKKMQKWKLQYDKDATNWDVCWTDCAVQAETLGKMHSHQKINHFPGMYSLARKNHLGRNLMRMAKQFPDQYKFFPKTWLLPAEYQDFRNQFQRGKLKTFIIKPEASCQGRGIFLTRDIDGVSPNEHYVAQRYLMKPYLIDDLKFDLRIYVLLAGCDPLRIYIYKEGLARFATEEYEAPSRDNMDNVCMHLTNYAINKDNSNFVFNEDANDMSIGHKRSMTSVFEQLKEQGEDVDKLWKTIKKIMIKTFCSVQPILSHHYKSCQPENLINNMCFEVLGMDVILNNKLKPFLLEVNHTPSFTTDTPLDSYIKRHLIDDTFKLMNINAKSRTETLNEHKEAMQLRVLTGKKTKLTPESKQALIKKLQIQRDEWEDTHLGNYEKVYPLKESDGENYEEFLQYAKLLYEEQTGAHIRRNTKKTITCISPQQNLSQISQNTTSTANSNKNQFKVTKSQDLEKKTTSKALTHQSPIVTTFKSPNPLTFNKSKSAQKSKEDSQIECQEKQQELNQPQTQNQMVKTEKRFKYGELIRGSSAAKQLNKIYEEPKKQYQLFIRSQQKDQIQEQCFNKLNIPEQTDIQQTLFPQSKQLIQMQKFDAAEFLSDIDKHKQRIFLKDSIRRQQQTQENNTQQAQGNYLTPKLFQLHGVNTNKNLKHGINIDEFQIKVKRI